MIYARETRVYGCMFEANREFELPGQGASLVVKRSTAPTLSGRFVAYSLYGSETEAIVSFDLKRGKQAFRAFAYGSQGRVSAVRAVVLKTNGSLAWIGQGPKYGSGEGADQGRPTPTGSLAVYRFETGQSKARRLDGGSDIEPTYLALSRDTKRVFWKDDDGRRAARLR